MNANIPRPPHQNQQYSASRPSISHRRRLQEDPDLQPVFRPSSRLNAGHGYAPVTASDSAHIQPKTLASTAAQASQQLSVAVDLPAAAHVYLWDSTPIGDSQVIDSLHLHGSASVKVANAALTALQKFVDRKDRKPAHGDLIGFFLSPPSKPPSSPSTSLPSNSHVPTDFACFDAGIFLEQHGERVPTNTRGSDSPIPVYWTNVSESALLQTLDSIYPSRRSTVFLYNAAMSKLVYCDLLQHVRLHLTPVRPLSLVENSVAVGLLRKNQQPPHSSGFITINRARCAYLLRNEPTQLPLVGVWASGCRPTSRQVLDTCLAFASAPNLSKLAGPPFLLACFPRLDPRPGQPDPPPSTTSPHYFTWRVESLGQACMMADFRASPGHWIVAPLKQVDVLGVTKPYEPPPQSLAGPAPVLVPDPSDVHVTSPASPRPVVSPARASSQSLPSGPHAHPLAAPSQPAHDTLQLPLPLPNVPLASSPPQIGDQSMHVLVNHLLKHIDILHTQLLATQSSVSPPTPLSRDSKSVGVNTPAEWLVPAARLPHSTKVLPEQSHAATETDDACLSMSVASRPPLGHYVPVFPPNASVAGENVTHDRLMNPADEGATRNDEEAAEYNVSVSDDALARIARMAHSGNQAVVVSSAAMVDDGHERQDDDAHIVPAWAAGVHGGKETVVVHAGYAGEAIDQERAPWDQGEDVDEARDVHGHDQLEPAAHQGDNVGPQMLPNPEGCEHEAAQETSHMDDDLTNFTMNLTLLDDELARKYLGNRVTAASESRKLETGGEDQPEPVAPQDLSPFSSGLVSPEMSSTADEGGNGGMDMSVATLEYLRKYGLLR